MREVEEAIRRREETPAARRRGRPDAASTSSGRRVCSSSRSCSATTSRRGCAITMGPEPGPGRDRVRRPSRTSSASTGAMTEVTAARRRLTGRGRQPVRSRRSALRRRGGRRRRARPRAREPPQRGIGAPAARRARTSSHIDRGHARLAQQAIGAPDRLVDRAEAPVGALGEPVGEAEAALGAERLVREVARNARRARSPVAERDEHVGLERVGLARRATSWSSPEVSSTTIAPLVAQPVRDRARRARARPGSTATNRRATRRRRRGLAPQRLALAHRRRPSRGQRADADERGERRGPADAVGREAGVALEVRADRVFGLGAEDAVLAAGVEAERVEPALELDRRRRRAASGARR